MEKKMRMVVGVMLISWLVIMPMAMGQWDLGSLMEKAKEAGVSEDTIQEAANSDIAKQALLDGSAEQALQEANDVLGDNGDSESDANGPSPWSDWLKNNVDAADSEGSSPAESPEGFELSPSSSLVGDIDTSPSSSPSSSYAPESAPLVEESQSLSYSPEESSPSSSPSYSPEGSPLEGPSPSYSPEGSPLEGPSPSSYSPESSPSSSPSYAPESASPEGSSPSPSPSVSSETLPPTPSPVLSPSPSPSADEDYVEGPSSSPSSLPSEDDYLF